MFDMTRAPYRTVAIVLLLVTAVVAVAGGAGYVGVQLAETRALARARQEKLEKLVAIEPQLEQLVAMVERQLQAQQQAAQAQAAQQAAPQQTPAQPSK